MTKTLTFGAVHMTVAFTVAWALRDSVLVGGAIALVATALAPLLFTAARVVA